MTHIHLKHIHRCCCILGAFLFLAAAGIGEVAAQGEIYVLESSAPGIRAGKVFAPGDKVSIPDGASIRAVMPSGKTQLIRGPYQGKAGDLATGHRPNPGVIAWLKSLLATGGATENTPGATRSARPQVAAAGFSWTVVPASTDSTICVEKGAALKLDRGALLKATRVTVVDAAVGKQGEATWAPGSKTAAWPSDVALRADATYALLVPDQPQRTVTLRVLDRLPGEDDVLAELEARGCRHQFEALVREKTGAGKG